MIENKASDENMTYRMGMITFREKTSPVFIGSIYISGFYKNIDSKKYISTN
jgi:hypothetical protein